MAKVLLADDSIAVRKVAERHLTEAGFAVMLAASGEEAIALLARERPDLIVCDVIMPDKSGYEVCTYTRSQESLAGTPVLLISGIVNDAVTRQAETCGANGVLKKPFQGTSLKDAVLDLLAKAPQARPADSDAAVAGSAPAEPPASGNDQVDTLVAQIEELKGALAREQERANELPRQLADQSQMQERITELEASLSSERSTAAQLYEQADEAAKSAQRIQELERELQHEREQAVSLKQQLAQLQQGADRAGELEEALGLERERTAELMQKLAEADKGSERVKELEAQLATERAQTTLLDRRLAESGEEAADRIEELETLLAKECEQTAVLTQRLTEAEEAAANATAREEEITQKLTRIADLSK